MNLTEHAAADRFMKAVDFLSRFQDIKFLSVNEAYHIQKHKIKEFKKTYLMRQLKENSRFMWE